MSLSPLSVGYSLCSARGLEHVCVSLSMKLEIRRRSITKWKPQRCPCYSLKDTGVDLLPVRDPDNPAAVAEVNGAITKSG